MRKKKNPLTMKTMKKIKKYLLTTLRMTTVDAVDTFKPGVRTLQASKKPSFNKWCAEFNVSSRWTRTNYG
jgi:hypothetical protein